VTVNTGVNLSADDSETVDCLGLLNKDSANPNTGDLLLDNGQASFTCVQTLDAASQVDSIKTINILLDYYAQDSITTNVLVKHLI
jgi:hypothetical protein